MMNLQVDLQIETPRGQAFLRRFFKGREVVKVPRTRTMTGNQCYTNVWTVVNTEGGEPVWGWALRDWPGHWLEATHHAVWRTPSGTLEDVTDVGLVSGATCFIVEELFAISQYNPVVCSKFHQTDRSVRTRFWIEGNIRRMKLLSQRVEIMKRHPHRVIDGNPTAPLFPPAVNQWDTQIETLTGELKAHRANFSRGIYDW